MAAARTMMWHRRDAHSAGRRRSARRPGARQGPARAGLRGRRRRRRRHAAVFQAGTNDYDGVILDVMLPVIDGLDVCRPFAPPACAVPILMLTARDAVESRVAGLDARRRRLPRQAVRLPRAARPPARADPPRPPAALPGAAVGRAAGHRHAAAACVRVGDAGCPADRRRNTRCSSTWPAAPATSSAGPTSPSTSGTSTTIRCRTSSTSTSSGCGASSTTRAPSR